jgi:hypothetical protein
MCAVRSAAQDEQHEEGGWWVLGCSAVCGGEQPVVWHIQVLSSNPVAAGPEYEFCVHTNMHNSSCCPHSAAQHCISLYFVCMQTSLGELRQEVGQVKQINTAASASRVGSQFGSISAWPAAAGGNSAAGSLGYQQQLQQQQAIDPLVHSLSRRFPSLTPRQHLDYSDAGAQMCCLCNGALINRFTWLCT